MVAPDSRASADDLCSGFSDGFHHLMEFHSLLHRSMLLALFVAVCRWLPSPDSRAVDDLCSGFSVDTLRVAIPERSCTSFSCTFVRERKSARVYVRGRAMLFVLRPCGDGPQSHTDSGVPKVHVSLHWLVELNLPHKRHFQRMFVGAVLFFRFLHPVRAPILDCLGVCVNADASCKSVAFG